ncbi:uncharacterized protein LOC6601076, partial [Drosophila persimilis]|uniref:uncharacterized protein LOC6601076 n=1 Tax=Drosophila persimilis TaxID=7234 RepID=UPI000F08389C
MRANITDKEERKHTAYACTYINTRYYSITDSFDKDPDSIKKANDQQIEEHLLEFYCSHGIHHICFASYCHQTQCLSSSAISHQPSATSHGRSNCLLPLPHLVPSASCLLPAASAFALK